LFTFAFSVHVQTYIHIHYSENITEALYKATYKYNNIAATTISLYKYKWNAALK